MTAARVPTVVLSLGVHGGALVLFGLLMHEAPKAAPKMVEGVDLWSKPLNLAAAAASRSKTKRQGAVHYGFPEAGHADGGALRRSLLSLSIKIGDADQARRGSEARGQRPQGSPEAAGVGPVEPSGRGRQARREDRDAPPLPAAPGAAAAGVADVTARPRRPRYSSTRRSHRGARAWPPLHEAARRSCRRRAGLGLFLALAAASGWTLIAMRPRRRRQPRRRSDSG